MLHLDLVPSKMSDYHLTDCAHEKNTCDKLFCVQRPAHREIEVDDFFLKKKKVFFKKKEKNRQMHFPVESRSKKNQFVREARRGPLFPIFSAINFVFQCAIAGREEDKHYQR